MDGHLYCSLGGKCDPILHMLSNVLPDELCSVVEMDGHVHGLSCGHELVLHDDHWDFLVERPLAYQNIRIAQPDHLTPKFRAEGCN